MYEVQPIYRDVQLVEFLCSISKALRFKPNLTKIYCIKWAERREFYPTKRWYTFCFWNYQPEILTTFSNFVF